MSYLLGDEHAGECIVIDPRRDAHIYIDLAQEHDCRLVASFDTHIHADFVSGARELEEMADVPIYGGKSEEYGYTVNQLEDGKLLEFGDLAVTCLHTPGHSPEHMCYLVRGGEGSEKDWGLFTGDTLFAGSVGRPDLASGHNPEDLAEKLYHSIFEKIIPLGAGIIVYPGHGSGSPCGGSIGDRDQTTIGYEAEHNEKLLVSGRDEFVKKVLDDLPDEPAYYKRLKKLNAEGAELFGEIPELTGYTGGNLSDLLEKDRKGCQVVDVREVAAFGAAHVPGALNIALRSSFPPWAGRVLCADKPIVLIGQFVEEILEAHDHLFRMGFDNVCGYLNGGMRTWIEGGFEIDQIGLVSAHELNQLLNKNDAMTLLDVRTDAEWNEGHIPSAIHAFAAEIEEHLEKFDRQLPTVVYCGSDFRADLAASLLRRNGFQNVSTLLGSVKAWLNAGFSMKKST
ncbi:MAG TPA: MBL fold metallo-hydrolase [Oceanipulchritudo sp.]|nr:MBL fold metallo-hydrolase [Oceanipulchritudo sp.]